MTEFEKEEKPTIQEQPVCKLKSKFKVGDIIQFKGYGHNEYIIAKVEDNRYVNTNGNGMDMSYTDANFELKGQPVCDDFGEEVEKVRQRFPEVGFAKISRIAHHFVEWQKKQVTLVSEELEEENND